MTNRKASERQLNYVCVCFLVDDVVKSAEYYRDVLGFSFNRYWGEPPCFVMLERDGVQFFLSGNGKRERSAQPDGPSGFQVGRVRQLSGR